MDWRSDAGVAIFPLVVDIFETDSPSVIAAISSNGNSKIELSSGDSDFVLRRSISSVLKELSLWNDAALLGGESGIEKGRSLAVASLRGLLTVKEVGVPYGLGSKENCQSCTKRLRMDMITVTYAYSSAISESHPLDALENRVSRKIAMRCTSLHRNLRESELLGRHSFH